MPYVEFRGRARVYIWLVFGHFGSINLVTGPSGEYLIREDRPDRRGNSRFLKGWPDRRGNSIVHYFISLNEISSYLLQLRCGIELTHLVRSYFDACQINIILVTEPYCDNNIRSLTFYFCLSPYMSLPWTSLPNTHNPDQRRILLASYSWTWTWTSLI